MQLQERLASVMAGLASSGGGSDTHPRADQGFRKQQRGKRRTHTHTHTHTRTPPLQQRGKGRTHTLTPFKHERGDGGVGVASRITARDSTSSVHSAQNYCIHCAQNYRIRSAQDLKKNAGLHYSVDCSVGDV